MKYLATAFAGEGWTDYRFAAPLVQRHLEVVLAAAADVPVEVGAIIPIFTEEGRPTNQREVVVDRLRSGDVFADLVYVHTDAGGSASDADVYRVDPIRDGLAELETPPSVIGVIPDRETEAWMLADIEALERVIGVASGSLNAPVAPRRLHTLIDPKAELASLLRTVDGSRRRGASSRHTGRVDRIYAGLATEIDFAALRRVPSFKRYEDKLLTVLQEREVLP